MRDRSQKLRTLNGYTREHIVLAYVSLPGPELTLFFLSFVCQVTEARLCEGRGQLALVHSGACSVRGL